MEYRHHDISKTCKNISNMTGKVYSSCGLSTRTFRCWPCFYLEINLAINFLKSKSKLKNNVNISGYTHDFNLLVNANDFSYTDTLELRMNL